MGTVPGTPSTWYQYCSSTITIDISSITYIRTTIMVKSSTRTGTVVQCIPVLTSDAEHRVRTVAQSTSTRLQFTVPGTRVLRIEVILYCTLYSASTPKTRSTVKWYKYQYCYQVAYSETGDSDDMIGVPFHLIRRLRYDAVEI